MFHSINGSSFGDYLKALRKKQKLTQTYVNEKTGINNDTIRRIENGEVIPKYETLAILSTVYKVDLVKKSTEFRVEPMLYQLYGDLDHCLLNYDIEGLHQIQNLLKDPNIIAHISSNLIDQNEILQFKYFLEVITTYFKDERPVSYNDSLRKLQMALSLTIPSFSVQTFHKKTYNGFELRILLLYALHWRQEGQYELSNRILAFIDQWMGELFFDELTTAKYRLKVHFSMAYNYHYLEQYEQSLDHANLGISIGKKYAVYNELYGLYFRKFTAEHYLGKSEAIESLQTCLLIMKLIGNEKLMNVYLESARTQYGIDTDTLFT